MLRNPLRTTYLKMTLRVMNGPSKRMFWVSGGWGRWLWFGNSIGALVETIGLRVGLDDVAPLGTKSFSSGSSAVDNVGLVKSFRDFDSHTLPPTIHFSVTYMTKVIMGSD
jgi:hypothetical protein